MGICLNTAGYQIHNLGGNAEAVAPLMQGPYFDFFYVCRNFELLHDCCPYTCTTHVDENINLR